MLKKKPISLMLAIVMLFMTCFMGFGYAVIVDTLRVEGTSEVQIPKGLFITQINVKSSTNVDHQEVVLFRTVRRLSL